MTLTTSVAGVVQDMPEVDYHAHPALSSSGARSLLKSPARFKWDRDHRAHSDAFDVGTAVHTLVLGTGWPVDVYDFDSWRSKAAQQAAEESRANGRVPLLTRDYLPIQVMAEAVLRDPRARAILERPGLREASVFADDPTTGVAMRARLDILTDDDDPTLMADLKTAVCAADDDFARSAAKYGYHVQQAWYERCLSLARGEAARGFRFIVVEKSLPHLVNVIELDAEFTSIGRAMTDRALRLYAECTAVDSWPGYENEPGEPNLIGPPAWLAYQEGMEFYA